jgi:hypothetical protein
MKLLVYELEQNRPSVGDEGSKLFDSRKEPNCNGRRTQTAIFLRPQMYSVSEKISKYLGSIIGRCEYKFLFCQGVAYVNSQTKRIPLNVGLRVIMGDFDPCCQNVY